MAQPKPTAPESGDFFTKVEDFFNENQKVVSISVSAVLLVVLAYVLFDKYYMPAQEQQAQEAVFKAQYYFELDSFNLALNGNATIYGFLDVIDDYGMTKTANLSQYYAGICYMNLGQYNDAIKHLKEFDSDDLYVGAMALGNIGDAHSELGNMSEAISYYKKAASYNDNNITAPMFLFKAGLALEAQGNPADALTLYQEIESKYPNSAQAAGIAAYIARVK